MASLHFLHRIPLGLVGQWGCPGEGKLEINPLNQGRLLHGGENGDAESKAYQWTSRCYGRG
jgi:hypothetical protein